VYINGLIAHSAVKEFRILFTFELNLPVDQLGDTGETMDLLRGFGFASRLLELVAKIGLIPAHEFAGVVRTTTLLRAIEQFHVIYK